MDLKAAKRIGRVNVWNRGDCCRERTQNVSVSLSLDGQTWTQVLQVPGMLGFPTTLDFGGAVGRYVRVQLAGTHYLHLGEVEVFPPFADLPNLARGKTAAQSSEYPGYPASLAVDGVTPSAVAGNFSHTAYQAQPWWRVDLGASQEIGQVVLWNRGDCCADRLRDFTVSLSEDGVNWSTTRSFPGSAGALTVADFARARGRYVRVRLNKTEFLHLGEVEVYPPR